QFLQREKRVQGQGLRQPEQCRRMREEGGQGRRAQEVVTITEQAEDPAIRGPPPAQPITQGTRPSSRPPGWLHADTSTLDGRRNRNSRRFEAGYIAVPCSTHTVTISASQSTS